MPDLQTTPTPPAPLPVSAHPEPVTPLGKWLLHGPSPEESAVHDHHAKPWYAVLWLTGVDYFSTLGYQPGIALLAAGALSPLATALLVLFTLFGALPVYHQVAKRSYIGQGSLAMLERLLTGWRSKFVLLVMLGFASTAFVITVTLSSADAAHHIVENPYLAERLHGGQLWVTLALMALLAIIFLRGFSEAIGLALAVGLPYIALNLIVVIRGVIEVVHHPAALGNWSAALTQKGDWTMLLLATVLSFPKLALGLSGFETGVAVMPLVKGEPDDATKPTPEGRIRNSSKLLTAAAVLMSVLLISTSFITAVLVPQEKYQEGGEAAGRVLAYLSHHLLGPQFGTIYDISTILILWFAGASAITGMLNLVPRYLPRLGLAPRWVAYARPLVLVLFVAQVLVTLLFKADVEAQAGAYATGVLGLMLSGSVAVVLSLDREAREQGRRGFRWESLYFWVITAAFVYALGENILTRPDGLVITGIFIVVIIALSTLSRYLRATELRVESITLVDPESEALWPELIGKRVSLVPIKHHDEAQIAAKAEEIRTHYRMEGSLAFMHVHLRDDRSEFASVLRVEIRRRGKDYFIDIHGAVAVANTIAYLSELLDPVNIFLGLTQQNSISQAINYLLWGEGETGILVYDILRRHWERTPEEDVRPFIYLLSEGGVA